MAPIRNDPVNLGDFLRMGAVGPSSFATAGSDDMTTVLVCELSEINAAGGAVAKVVGIRVTRSPST